MRQSGEDWLNWKRAGVTSTDAAALKGVDPYGETSYTRWLDKKGQHPGRPVNAAMQRGTALEPIAREAYEKHTGLIMQPVTTEAPKWPVARASLDGLTLSGDVHLEIKCPGASTMLRILAGEPLPQHWEAQVQHQFFVAETKVCHLWVFDGERGHLIEVYPSSHYIAELIVLEREFWHCVVEDIPPALTDRDVIARADSAWLTAAQEYRCAEAAAVEWTAKKEAARELLDSLAGSAVRVMGGGVMLTRYTREGNVNYKAIPELKDVDLDRYRGKSTQAFRVSIDKA